MQIGNRVKLEPRSTRAVHFGIFNFFRYVHYAVVPLCFTSIVQRSHSPVHRLKQSSGRYVVVVDRDLLCKCHSMLSPIRRAKLKPTSGLIVIREIKKKQMQMWSILSFAASVSRSLAFFSHPNIFGIWRTQRARHTFIFLRFP